MLARYHNNAIPVCDNDVAGTNQYTPNSYRLVNRLNFVSAGPDATTAVHVIEVNRDLLLDYFIRVPNTPMFPRRPKQSQ